MSVTNGTVTEGVKPRAKCSAYAFFVKACKDDLKTSNIAGDKESRALFTKRCAEQWKVMSDVDKAVFKAAAESDKERFEREMSTYSPPSSGEETKPVKRKRSTKEKDPNAPKRPLTAFFVFTNEMRAGVKAENPNMSVGEVAKHLGLVWRELPADQKQRFLNKYEENKSNYVKQVEAYNNGSNKGASGNNVVNAGEEDDKENDSD